MEAGFAWSEQEMELPPDSWQLASIYSNPQEERKSNDKLLFNLFGGA
jgi:hypothetical protein